MAYINKKNHNLLNINRLWLGIKLNPYTGEFIDGSIKAQLGVPDMKIPIQYALTYPNRSPSNWTNFDLSKIGKLHFEKPDFDKFPCVLKLF